MPSRRLLILLLATSLLPAVSCFGIIQQTNNTVTMGWTRLPNNLPANALAIAASTDTTNPDFVAVASDSTTHDYNFYLLDHAHLQLGWQKKYCFFGADATNLQYGFDHFVAMGTDRSTGKPVVATSADNGRTWTQNLVFAGTGHYDNAAFSDKTGMMTGKDGAIAITTNGTEWAETTPPNGIARKIICTNIGPSGFPADYEFQLCVTLPTSSSLDASRLCGLLTFENMPVLGSLISSDGKNWNYTIPYPIMKNQLLLFNNKTFLVNDNLPGISYHNSTNLQQFDFQGIELDDPNLPLIEIFQFTSYRQYWIAVGYDLKTGLPLSLVSNNFIYNNCMVFSADFFPQAVRLIAANQCGFIAVGDDGTCYYSTPAPQPAAP